MTTPRCPLCGIRGPEGVDLCLHHALATAAGWAAEHKALCDCLHRNVPLPPRLPQSERDPAPEVLNG